MSNLEQEKLAVSQEREEAEATSRAEINALTADEGEVKAVTKTIAQ